MPTNKMMANSILLVLISPSRPKHHAKDECINRQHQYGVKKRPQHSHHRASVSTNYFAPSQLPD